ncbi:MAG: saccharopine dehydrogenase family protein [Thermoplasmatota archaeon]
MTRSPTKDAGPGRGPWMIYGAYGYTGELIAREAARRGWRPILAGRDPAKLQPLAAELGLPHRVFGLDDVAALREGLQGVALVMHCAGPFSATARPMLDACLAAGVNYLDITGEVDVLEATLARDADAMQAGIVVCPAVGFDVIPTDCVAAALKAALPDATHLALGFDSRSGLSPGTTKTAIEGAARGGRVREDGKLRDVRIGHHVRRIDFGDGEKSAMAIPWGDLATAFVTTGIPNIEVYTATSPRRIAMARRAHRFRAVLGLAAVQRFLKSRASRVRGPDARQRDERPTFVWGEARNAAGSVKTARMKVANGYSITATGALAVVDFVLTQRPAPGAYTPALLCGADLVAGLPESGPLRIQ